MSATDLDFDKYKVTAKWPEKAHKPGLRATPAEHRAWAEWLEAGEAKYKEELRAYREEEAEILSGFKIDALAAANLIGHPKADKVWSMAWDEGHAGGFNEVAIWVDKLAELVL